MTPARLLARLACLAWGAHSWAPLGALQAPAIPYERCRHCHAIRLRIFTAPHKEAHP